MRLGVIDSAGRRRAGLVGGGWFRPFRAPFDGQEPAALAHRPDLNALATEAPIPAASATFAAPTRPAVLLCADDNFRCQPRPRRAGLALHAPDVLRPYLTGAPIEDVLVTAADPGCLVVDGTEVIRPRGCDRLDVGVSLAAVVGTDARIAGYATVLDFARLDVPPTQGYLARSFATHKVISTSIVVGDDLPAVPTLRLAVDGKHRQCATIAAMIARPAELVGAIARRYPLRPGDLVLTGSPAGRPGDSGAGWVCAGSVVCGWITGVGAATAAVVAEP